MKIVLVLLYAYLFKNDIINRGACYEVKEIRCHKEKSWEIQKRDGTTEQYDEMNILMHNFHFQLLQFKHVNKRKIYILFNDQLSSDQWRMIHLMSHFK